MEADLARPAAPPLRGVAETAQWTAAARARESRRPDRLFLDPYAGVLAGPEGEALLRRFHTRRGASDGNPVLAIRTRWFDDFLVSAVRPGFTVVVLGAGLDTRALRLRWPAGVVLYEVDQPEVLAYKESKIAGSSPRCERRTVPADLAADWADKLLAAGHDPAAPTVWFAEGLLFYLPEALARDVLAQAARLSGPGSRLAADLIGRGVFGLRYMGQFLRTLEAAQSPWVFGTDAPGEFIQGCGWTVDVLTEPGRADASYHRWPAGSAPDAFPQLPRAYFVTASKPAPDILNPDGDD
jgi:methyltransferase (TIGR00027 family)